MHMLLGLGSRMIQIDTQAVGVFITLILYLDIQYSA